MQSALAPALDGAIERFTGDTGIAVVVEPFDDMVDPEQLREVAAAGTGPDIFMGPHDWTGELAEAELVVPIDLADVAPDFAAFTVEAVLYRFRTGCPWRDLPERFGSWKTIHQRFSRWAKGGVFERIFKLLAEDHDNEYVMIDATIVRAHQHSAGARKKTVRKPSAGPAAGRAPKSTRWPTR